MRILLILLCVACLAVSCTSTQEKTDEESSKIAFREELNEVKTNITFEFEAISRYLSQTKIRK